MQDKSEEYVSLGAVDRCRDYSFFRIASKNGAEAMASTRGSSSYVFVAGVRSARSQNDEKVELKQKPIAQTDRYISTFAGKDTATRYTYISEEDANKCLDNSCQYIQDTDWAVLITPKMTPQISSLLNALDKADMLDY